MSLGPPIPARSLATDYLRWLLPLTLAGPLAACAVLLFTVLLPMAERSADDLAGLLVLAAQTWAELPPESRPDFEAELQQAHRLSLRVETRTPAPDNIPPSAPLTIHGYYIARLEDALARRIGRSPILFQDSDPAQGLRVWVDIDTGAGPVQLGFRHERLATRSLGVLVGALMLGMGAAVALALWLARRIAEPVRQLEQAVAAMSRGDEPEPLALSGPAELARLADHFNRMARRVRELLEARTTLLAGISHDLRTPLARMRLAVEMLRIRPEARLLDRLDRDIEETDALIARALELARGFSAQTCESVALMPWLREQGQARADAIAQAGATVEIAGPEDLQVSVPPQALARVFDNLLGNALRYAGGPIEIRVGPPPDATATRARLHVLDRGPGIPPAQRDAVWRPFQRVEGSRNRSTGGQGLGLAIVAQLARAQGWSVGMDPRPGGGLDVWVDLPQTASDPSNGSPKGSTLPL